MSSNDYFFVGLVTSRYWTRRNPGIFYCCFLLIWSLGFAPLHLTERKEDWSEKYHQLVPEHRICSLLSSEPSPLCPGLYLVGYNFSLNIWLPHTLHCNHIDSFSIQEWWVAFWGCVSTPQLPLKKGGKYHRNMTGRKSPVWIQRHFSEKEETWYYWHNLQVHWLTLIFFFFLYFGEGVVSSEDPERRRQVLEMEPYVMLETELGSIACRANA